MSGLLALLDDVAAIAKVAASTVDDVAAAAAKAGSKTMGILIDDAAVTPKYVTGFSADRELPIIGRIALGSFANKLLILLPGLMLLQYFLPQVITPLLMLGGCYLCFEGAEKVWHVLAPHSDAHVDAAHDTADAAGLEAERVSGAIKTDFILSAEIMTISLSVIEAGSLWMQALTLGAVGVMVTVLIYGVVALIVKMDDIGLWMASNSALGLVRGLGRGLIKGMPKLLWLLSVVGTAAMLWVGGNIVVHGLETTGWWPAPYLWIKAQAATLAAGAGEAQGFVNWLATAAMDGVIGLVLGFIIVVLVTKLVLPALGRSH